MPTTQEKNLIANLGATGAQLAIVELAGLGLIGGGLLGLAFLPLLAGLEAQRNRIRFPQISTGDIGRLARASARGSRVISEPFFGDFVISTPDQAPILGGLIRDAAARRVAAETDFSEIFRVRQAVIEGLAETAVERGFASEIDPDLRGGVFRASADAPLQFIEGNFLP